MMGGTSGIVLIASSVIKLVICCTPNRGIRTIVAPNTSPGLRITFKP